MASTVIDISPPAPVNLKTVTPSAGGDIELKWEPGGGPGFRHGLLPRLPLDGGRKKRKNFHGWGRQGAHYLDRAKL